MADRIAVVSFLAHDPKTVRGLRTQKIVSALRESTEVDVIAGRGHPDFSTKPWARAWRLASRQVVLDHLEVGARLDLRGVDWSSYTGAVLVGYPYSPLVLAADRLHRSGVPYVADIGDPWALTALRKRLPPIASHRACRAEFRLWSRAAAGVVTTFEQAARLREHVPNLDLLIRPNGVDLVEAPKAPRRAPDGLLRIAHYGGIYGDRLPVAEWLRALGKSDRWQSIEFHQFGDVWATHLPGLVEAHPNVHLTLHEQLPWQEVVNGSIYFDVAFATGFHDPSQLPSKAITYQTLPIPKVALVASDDSALAKFVADRPDWLRMTVGTPAAKLHEFLATSPSVICTVPEEELWPNVSAELAGFYRMHLMSSTRPTR